jgi:hypothetical protein
LFEDQARNTEGLIKTLSEQTIEAYRVLGNMKDAIDKFMVEDKVLVESRNSDHPLVLPDGIDKIKAMFDIDLAKPIKQLEERVKQLKSQAEEQVKLKKAFFDELLEQAKQKAMKKYVVQDPVEPQNQTLDIENAIMTIIKLERFDTTHDPTF